MPNQFIKISYRRTKIIIMGLEKYFPPKNEFPKFILFFNNLSRLLLIFLYLLIKEVRFLP
jgi:hypothetical protein